MGEEKKMIGTTGGGGGVNTANRDQGTGLFTGGRGVVVKLGKRLVDLTLPGHVGCN